MNIIINAIFIVNYIFNIEQIVIIYRLIPNPKWEGNMYRKADSSVYYAVIFFIVVYSLWSSW